jgi:pyruvate formate lyase activating enzyme
MKTGVIFDFKRFAVHDGPGIRTTVFFKGCPLKCPWCHNPESWGVEPEIIIKKDVLGEKEFLKEETIGKEYSVEQLFNEVEKDRVFFEESGGGVTFSGGEPFMQHEFLMEILEKCREENIHRVLDTCGYCPIEIMERTVDLVDLYLYDIKIMDDEKHKVYTGVSNKVILENLDLLLENEKDVVIRYPIVPGYNDSKADIRALIEFLVKKEIADLNILPFHDIADHKYRLLGRQKLFDNIKEPEKEKLEELKFPFEKQGIHVKVGG